MMNNNKKNSNVKSSFFTRFYPTYIYNKVEEIPHSIILNRNIKVAMLDMDNTIINYSEKKYSKELKKWVKELKKKGVKVYILSNSIFSKLVKRIAKELGMQYYYNAKKPSLKGFENILKKENVTKQEMIMIGDQLFTDIWGGNRFGIRTILVTPIDEKEHIHTKIKRPLEKIILKKYFNDLKKGNI